MAACKATDEQILEAWGKFASPSKVAKALGLSIRNLHTRRAQLEHKLGRELKTVAEVGNEHPKRLDLGIENGQIVVFSDAHFWPGIRTTAFKGLLCFINELQPRAVVANGDLFDGAGISRHPSIAWEKVPSVIEELKACEAALEEIEFAAGDAKLIWPLGNHDARFESKLSANAPQFEFVQGFHLKDHFPSWQPCWAVWNGEDTVIKHRWKGGVHAAHNNTVGSGVNIVTGHLHSLKVTPFDDYRGTRFGVDTGTLADPSGPQFRAYLEESPTNWRSGFVVLTFKDGRLLWPEIVSVFDKDHVQFRGEVINVSKF
jgi:hypothetical protein